MDVDILFSDHNIAAKSLEDLGGAIKAINQVTEHPALRFDSFLCYISEKHRFLLRYEIPPDNYVIVQDVLDKANIPEFQLQPGRNGSFDAKPEASPEKETVKRPWWQFWNRGP